MEYEQRQVAVLKLRIEIITDYLKIYVFCVRLSFGKIKVKCWSETYIVEINNTAEILNESATVFISPAWIGYDPGIYTWFGSDSIR